MNVYCVFIVKGHSLPNVVHVYTSVNLILITVAAPEQQEPSNISRPSLLLWKPASSISDHDCKMICCIIVYCRSVYVHVHWYCFKPLTCDCLCNSYIYDFVHIIKPCVSSAWHLTIHGCHGNTSQITLWKLYMCISNWMAHYLYTPAG